MGTNYYIEAEVSCEDCGHKEDEDLHIGKSSVGWAFALRIYPDKGISSLDDWIAELRRNDGWIINEYGDKVPYEKMLACITDRSHPHGLRFQNDDPGGGVTYVYIEREFS